MCSSDLLAFAAGLIVVAALLRVALGDNTPRFVTFYPAVALAALIGGPIAGITATLASLAGALVLMWAKVWIPNGSLHLDIVSFGNFTLTGLLMSLIAAADLGALRRDRGRTAAAVDASETHHRTILAALHEGVLVFTQIGRAHV